MVSGEKGNKNFEIVLEEGANIERKVKIMIVEDEKLAGKAIKDNMRKGVFHLSIF